MNKKLIALAVGTAMGIAPMAASAAKVTVYGHAQVEIHNTDITVTNNAVPANSLSGDVNALSDNARGRFGIKASEKLGNGMTAIAKFEFRLDTTTNNRGGGNTSTPRESFVGLKGNFGTVQLGNLKSAYKYTGGVKYDAFVATVLEARNQGGMSGGDLGNKSFGHNSFMANSIGYITPKMNGFQGWLTYSPDETFNSKGDDGDMTLSVKYNNGPMELFVKYVNNDDNVTGSSTGGDGVAFGGAYKFGNHKVMGQYELLDRDALGDVDYYFLAYHFKSGNNTFVGQLGNRDPDTVSEGETDYYMVGLVHALSKKTRLTIGYSNSDRDAVSAANSLGGSGQGREVETFAVGMRMIF